MIRYNHKEKKGRFIWQAKKADGKKLGRPTGRGKSKLDEHIEEILKLVDLQVPKTIIARQYNTSVANLHRFLKSV